MKIFVSLLTLLCSLTSLHAAVEEKISSTKSQMTSKKIEEKKISKKLEALASDITRESRKLAKLKKDIRITLKNIEQQQSKSKIKSRELQKIEKLYTALEERENSVNRKITGILSKEIAISMIHENGDDQDSQRLFDQDNDDIIMKEVLQTYHDVLKAKFSKTKERYQKLQRNRKIIQSELKKLRFKINTLNQQKTKLSKLSNLQNATIHNLHKTQKAYLRKLARIRKEKQTLSAMLEKLKILKHQKERTRIKHTQNTNMNVRQIGSSYQKSAIAKYTGAKTIAPLKSYKLIQKFGNFTDPIYKIKIFNDNVILKSKVPDSVVRNVLNGKVVYANKAPMLGYVVIVEHAHKIHTIYAHLSKIAPTIKENKKIPRGYVIGKVADELTFEVTQNEKHINPMQMIR